jgi:hypothetical protein
MANPSPIPSMVKARPVNVAPMPQQTPKPAIADSALAEVKPYTAATLGTVTSVSNHGKTTSPVAANMSQMFSYFHPRANFMGTAKTP